MTIRTNLKAGRAGGIFQHNETLQVRTALKAGAMKVRSALKAGAAGYQHNETLQVRTALKAGAMKVRSALKAGAHSFQHNETLRRDSERPVISMRREPRTTGRKEDRLELLVVRAGLRAGRVIRSAARHW